MDEIVGLAPSGSLGSGYNVESFNRALESNPDFIGQDAGSTDMGPTHLGDGVLFFPESSYRHDLSLMLNAAREREIPLLVGSCITAGTRGQLDQAVAMVKDLAREAGHSFKMAVIDAELDKDFLKKRLADGAFQSLGPESELTAAGIDRSSHIVAQMGVEPFVRALEAGADVVLAGRACDDVIFAAMPVMKGFDKGLSLHMGKILECAGLSASPIDLQEPLIGRIRDDHFVVEPGKEDLRCTTVSVASHSLYERSDPCIQPGPGGVNDLSETVFEQLDERSVKVSGSRFIPDSIYKVKLEGAEVIGYRSVVMSGIRDAIMISQIDDILEEARERVRQRFDTVDEGDYHLDFHIYGKNAVMRSLEPETDHVPLEIGLLIDVVAKTQDLANAVAMHARGTLGHTSYPGIITTAGNLAFPFSPFNVPVGPACRFSLYHLMPLDDPCECFPMEMITVGGT